MDGESAHQLLVATYHSTRHHSWEGGRSVISPTHNFEENIWPSPLSADATCKRKKKKGKAVHDDR